MARNILSLTTSNYKMLPFCSSNPSYITTDTEFRKFHAPYKRHDTKFFHKFAQKAGKRLSNQTDNRYRHTSQKHKPDLHTLSESINNPKNFYFPIVWFYYLPFCHVTILPFYHFIIAVFIFSILLSTKKKPPAKRHYSDSTFNSRTCQCHSHYWS